MVKRVLMVIAPERFRDEELFHTRAELEKAGAKVVLASTRKAPCSGMLGGTANPDAHIDTVKAEEYDAVVFVGGGGAEVYFGDVRAHKLAQDATRLGKTVGAICIAPSILANAGLLRGKRATVWEGAKYVQLLRNGGAVYTGEPVTQDGRIITANGPGAARDFGRALAKSIGL